MREGRRAAIPWALPVRQPRALAGAGPLSAEHVWRKEAGEGGGRGGTVKDGEDAGAGAVDEEEARGKRQR
eukprot:1256266-Rhodomonas_salina.1